LFTQFFEALGKRDFGNHPGNNSPLSLRLTSVRNQPTAIRNDKE
jgi:hypothetical protein